MADLFDSVIFGDFNQFDITSPNQVELTFNSIIVENVTFSSKIKEYLKKR